MGAGGGCVCRERLGCCDSDERRGGHLLPATHDEFSPRAVEALLQQVAQLQRRNAALEEAVAATPHQSVSSEDRSVSKGSYARIAMARATSVASNHNSLLGSATVLPTPHLEELSLKERGLLLQEAAQDLLLSVPLPIGLVFPNSAPGLGRSLSGASRSPGAQALLRRASAVLQYDLEQIWVRGPDSKLDATRYCQPSVYVASVVAVERLREERPEVVERCQAVAGIGVGEYAALHVAGVFSFEVGLRLVQVRAEAMHLAAAAGEQQQLAITGVELERARALCEEARRGAGGSEEVCSVACAVAPKAQICAGSKAAAQQLLLMGQTSSGADGRVSLLDTPQDLGHGAFQTILMKPAQHRLRVALGEALPSMRPPRCAVYFNVMGEALPVGAAPSLVAELLAAQLTSTVLWEQTARTMVREGLEEVYVCGPRMAAQHLREVIPKISVTICAT